MTALRLEKIGDRLGVILDEAARIELNAKAGDMVHVSRAAPESPEVDQDDGRHERGRAFLKRYRKHLGTFAP